MKNIKNGIIQVRIVLKRIEQSVYKITGIFFSSDIFLQSCANVRLEFKKRDSYEIVTYGRGTGLYIGCNSL